MTQLGSVTKTAVTMPATGPAWKHWNLVALTGLTAYSTAVSWLAQQVMYPLYRAVGPGEFAAYHLQYNDAIPAPIVIPGFVGFASAVAFLWTRPAGVPRWAAALVSLGGVTCIASTVLWAIPMHDRLDAIGQDPATIDSLLSANLIRTAALTLSVGVLGWCLGRLLNRSQQSPKAPSFR